MIRLSTKRVVNTLLNPILAWFESLLDPYYDEPNSLNSSRQPPKQVLAFVIYVLRTPGVIAALCLAALCCVEAILEVYLWSSIGSLVASLSTKEDSLSTFEILKESETVLLSCLAYLLIFSCGTLVGKQTLSSYMQTRVSWVVNSHLLRQSIGFYESDFSGRIASKVMTIAGSTAALVWLCSNGFAYNLVYLAGVILALSATGNVYIALPFIIWSLSHALILYRFTPKIRSASLDFADTNSLYTGKMMDVFSNITTVKSFSNFNYEKKYLQKALKQRRNASLKLNRVLVKLNLLNACNQIFLILASLSISIFFWKNNYIGLEQVIVSSGFVLRVVGLSYAIKEIVLAFFEHMSTLEDGLKLISRPIELEDCSDASILKNVSGKLEFAKISFSYNSQPLLDEFNLLLQPGEKVGIVGQSGVGKTTLIKLLLRFYDVKSGSILIDDHDIRLVTQESLRASISSVSQDICLLNRSVRDNLKYGNPNATEDQLIRATEQANALEFILELRDPKGRVGFDAHVGERGVKLSGGQRQRLAIARIFLKNAPILVLDEATSALDSEAEAAIQENLSRLMRDRTVLAIAHRLSTIAMLDRLIVIHNGKIAEQGTHLELLQKENGIYSSLWKLQSGGFL